MQSTKLEMFRSEVIAVYKTISTYDFFTMRYNNRKKLQNCSDSDSNFLSAPCCLVTEYKNLTYTNLRLNKSKHLYVIKMYVTGEQFGIYNNNGKFGQQKSFE